MRQRIATIFTTVGLLADILVIAGLIYLAFCRAVDSHGAIAALLSRFAHSTSTGLQSAPEWLVLIVGGFVAMAIFEASVVFSASSQRRAGA